MSEIIDKTSGSEDDRHVFLYARVSTLGQDSGLSTQVMALTNHLKQNEITNYKLFQDHGVSGAKASRPALDQMFAEIKAGKCKQLVTFSFSRLSRSVTHLLHCLKTVEAHDTQLVSLSERLDSKTPMGRAMITVVACLSELERETLIERVRAGLARAKLLGVRLGAPRKRPSAFIRKLVIKNCSYRTIIELANTSSGCVGAEIKEMKAEMSKETEMPVEEISKDEVAAYFGKKNPLETKKTPVKKEVPQIETVIDNTFLSTRGQFGLNLDLDLDTSSKLELDKSA